MLVNQNGTPNSADGKWEHRNEEACSAEAKPGLPPKPKRVLRPGSKVGRLTLIEARTDHLVSRNGCRYRRRMWRCECECGKQIVTQEANLRAGKTRSCGCLAIEVRRTRGGASRQPHLCHAWRRMLGRCYNPTSPDWQHCGARGIHVCDRWLGPDGLANFLADVGPRPSPRHRLTRIDPDRDYTPNNYGWTLPGQFRAPRRPHKGNLITHAGETHNQAGWARLLGLTPVGFGNRLARTTDPEVIFAPRRGRRRIEASRGVS